MFNAANILEALKNYIRTRGGTSNAYNIAEAVNDLNSIPQGSGGDIPEAPIDNKQYARKNGDWSEVESSGGDIPSEVTNAIETHGMGWTDEEEVEGFDIQWDGNTEGLESIYDQMYKVTSEVDNIASKDDLIGAKIEAVGLTMDFPFTLSADDISTEDGKVFACIVREGPVVFVAIEDGEAYSMQFTKGVWFLETRESAYITRLYKEASTEEVVHQIDQKYIPQSSGGGVMVVTVTISGLGVGEITADKSLDEIKNSYFANNLVFADVYKDGLRISKMTCVRADDTSVIFGFLMPNFSEETGDAALIVYLDPDTGDEQWFCGML